MPQLIGARCVPPHCRVCPGPHVGVVEAVPAGDPQSTRGWLGLPVSRRVALDAPPGANGLSVISRVV